MLNQKNMEMEEDFKDWFRQEMEREPTAAEITVGLEYFKWGWNAGFGSAQDNYEDR